MIREVARKLGFIEEEKPMSPKERIKRQEETFKLVSEEEKRKRKVVMLHRNMLASAHVDVIVNNCVKALDQASKRGFSQISAHIKLRSKPVSYFTKKHWKTLVKALTDLGYRVSDGYGPYDAAYNVTNHVRRWRSQITSRPGPLDGGLPTKWEDGDGYSSGKVVYCYYLVSLPQ
jgi:hypothetical protein